MSSLKRKTSELEEEEDTMWIRDFVAHDSILEDEEKLCMQQYFNTTDVDHETQARVVSIVDTLIDQRLTKNDTRRTKSNSLVVAQQAWKSFFKNIQNSVTTPSSFKATEVDFIMEILQHCYAENFIARDKRKCFGPFRNKTFWSELTYKYNCHFVNRMRGVVAIRNKVKGLLQKPPAQYELILQKFSTMRDQYSDHGIKTISNPMLSSTNLKKSSNPEDWTIKQNQTDLTDIATFSETSPLSPLSMDSDIDWDCGLMANFSLGLDFELEDLMDVSSPSMETNEFARESIPDFQVV